MKRNGWYSWKDFFTFTPPQDNSGVFPFESTSTDQNKSEDFRAEDLIPGSWENRQQTLHWKKIKFDNGIRALISIPTYILCFGLWIGGFIPSIIPMTVVFAGFAAIQLASLALFKDSKFAIQTDYFLCGVDLIAMSFAVYFTGGSSSPLYFIYVLPLIVHTFHRDWGLILFNGIGGGVLYTLAILGSLEEFSRFELTGLGARLIFLTLTLFVVAITVKLLKKKDEVEQLRLDRLRALTLIGQKLNRVSSLQDLSDSTALIIPIINMGLGEHLKTWSRVLLLRDDGSLMKSIEDPNQMRPELKQEISMVSCPAMFQNKNFLLEDSDSGHECPTENFTFGSHMCTPVNGTDNQAFGVLFCGSPKKKAFLLEEKEFLQYIARSLGLAVERLKRVEELKKGVEMNSCVMATYISSARSLADTYASILEGVMTITSVDLTLLMLWDNTNGLLSTIMKRGRLEYFDGTGTCEMGEGIPGRVLEKGEPYWTTDLQQDPFFKSKHENTKAVLCLPLRTMKGEPLGVIVACRYAQTQDFSNNEVDTASTFALRASMALENAFLHEKERGCIVELKSPPVSQKAA